MQPNIENLKTVMYHLTQYSMTDFINSGISAKSYADNECNSSASKPANHTGYAFMSFDDSNEIRDLETTAGIDGSAPIYVNNELFANNLADLLDGSLSYRSFDQITGVGNGWFWTFSNNRGGFDASNSCNGGSGTATADNISFQGAAGRFSSTSAFVDNTNHNCSDTSRYLVCIAKPN